jgi:hypothetical protein
MFAKKHDSGYIPDVKGISRKTLVHRTHNTARFRVYN